MVCGGKSWFLEQPGSPRLREHDTEDIALPPDRGHATSFSTSRQPLPQPRSLPHKSNLLVYFAPFPGPALHDPWHQGIRNADRTHGHRCPEMGHQGQNGLRCLCYSGNREQGQLERPVGQREV